MPGQRYTRSKHLNEPAPVTEQHSILKKRPRGRPNTTAVPTPPKLKVTRSSRKVGRHKKSSMAAGDAEARMPDDNAGFLAAIIEIQQQIAQLTKSLNAKMGEMAKNSAADRRSWSTKPRRDHERDQPLGSGHDTPTARRHRCWSRVPERQCSSSSQLTTDSSDDSDDETAHAQMKSRTDDKFESYARHPVHLRNTDSKSLRNCAVILPDNDRDAERPWINY